MMQFVQSVPLSYPYLSIPGPKTSLTKIFCIPPFGATIFLQISSQNNIIECRRPMRSGDKVFFLDYVSEFN